MIFKSVARVRDDNPDTHKFRLAGDDELVLEVDDGDELLFAFEDVSSVIGI